MTEISRENIQRRGWTFIGIILIMSLFYLISEDVIFSILVPILMILGSRKF